MGAGQPRLGRQRAAWIAQLPRRRRHRRQRTRLHARAAELRIERERRQRHARTADSAFRQGRAIGQQRLRLVELGLNVIRRFERCFFRRLLQWIQWRGFRRQNRTTQIGTP